MTEMDEQVDRSESASPMAGPSTAGDRQSLHVLLLDASALNRSCFSAGLDEQQNIRLVASATLEEIIPSMFARGAPDVTILRLSADEGGEDELASKLQALTLLFPRSATILIVPTAEPRHVLAALHHSVVGLTTDQLSMTSTIDVMRLVHAGMVVYPPALFDSFRQIKDVDVHPSVGAQRSRIGRLTARQHEVLRLLAGGMPNKGIAEELGISGSTVKVHVRAIMERLGLGNRTQAAACFLEGQS